MGEKTDGRERGRESYDRDGRRLFWFSNYPLTRRVCFNWGKWMRKEMDDSMKLWCDVLVVGLS